MNEQNVKQIIDMVQKGIDTASKNLGVAVPHLWEVLIRQQYIKGIQGIVTFIVSLVCIYPLWRLTRYFRNLEEEDPYSAWDFATFFTFIGMVVLITIGFFSFYDSIGQLLNPEYYAIQDIIKLVKGQ